MKRLPVLLLCCLLLMPAAYADLPDDAEVDRMFEGAKTVGGSVVVYSDGQLVYARDYGYKDLNQSLPTDRNTYFRTASLTKMVTGIGLMILAEQGKLDLDADISDYLGYKAGNPHFTRRPITLRQLMSHTSSVTDSGGFSSLRSKLSDMLKLSLKRTGNFKRCEPGSGYSYSNFGAGITGALMEAASGQSVNAFMRGEVFAPLGIDAAYAAGLLQNPRDVSGQYKGGKVDKSASLSLRDEYEDFADPDMHFRTTIGDLWMRSRDMAKLLAMLCNGGVIDGKRLLSEDSVNQMMAEQSSLNKSVTSSSPYGLFLEHNGTLVKGKTFYGHQGMTSGAILNAYFEPESRFVFVLFSNGGSLVRSDHVGKLARKMIEYFYPMYSGESGL